MIPGLFRFTHNRPNAPHGVSNKIFIGKSRQKKQISRVSFNSRSQELWKEPKVATRPPDKTNYHQTRNFAYLPYNRLARFTGDKNRININATQRLSTAFV